MLGFILFRRVFVRCEILAQSRRGFELSLPCPFPTTINPSSNFFYVLIFVKLWHFYTLQNNNCLDMHNSFLLLLLLLLLLLIIIIIIIIIIIMLHLESFSHQRQLTVFHWRLSERKSPQVSRTLLSILADLPLFPSPCTSPLVTLPRAPITNGITVTFMFHCFFNSLARSRYLLLFSLSFNFTPWSDWTAKSTIPQVLSFFVDYYEVWSSGRD